MALNVALWVGLIFAFLLYRYIIYPAFLSPLAKIPSAHPTSPFSTTWMNWKERTTGQAGSLLAAHQRYGPVIRIAPNEVHTASLEGLRVAFNSGRFERADWWLQFRNFDGTHNLLTMLDSKTHATRRRMLSQIFSKSYMLANEELHILAQVLLFERFLPVFDDAATSGQGVDVYEMSFAACAEFMNAYQVGTAFCMDIMRKDREHARKEYLENGRTKILELEGREKAAKYLENLIMKSITQADTFLQSNSSPNDEKRRKLHSMNVNGQSESATSLPVVFTQLRNSIPDKEGVKDVHEILTLIGSELVDNLEAARIAGGITITYALYEVTKRPAILTALREELMTLETPLTYPPGENKISTATLRQLDKLPLLEAVVVETLRARSPVLMPFRRIVPEGGAVIDGFYLPAGVVISSSSLPLHMNDVAYPNPKEWDPKRWLGIPDDAEKGKAFDDPRRWFWGFGSGGRMCVGNNYAMFMMKLVVAGIFTNYTTHIIEDDGMEQLDRFVASPASEKLVLGFKRITKA